MIGPNVVVASAARTTSGNFTPTASQAGTREYGGVLALAVSVTAATGTTPTLDLSVEWSHDGGTTWCAGEPVDSFTQITATKNVAKAFTVKAPLYRVVWAIGGTTPSFTFAVSEVIGR